MKTTAHPIRSRLRRSLAATIALATCAFGLILTPQTASAQEPPATAPSMRTRAPKGQSTIPDATPEQLAVIDAMNSTLVAPTIRLANARAELLKSSLATPSDASAIKSKVDDVARAELAFATARADLFGKIQTSANRLSLQQLEALMALPSKRSEAGRIPDLTTPQSTDLTQMSGAIRQFADALTAQRAALARSSFANPRDDAAIKTNVENIRKTESELETARAAAFEKIQSSPHKLTDTQVSALVAMGGALIAGGFSEPQPYDFNDHTGYVSLFDGKSLKGWDGHPKFWRVEDGAIVGESTPKNLSGNTYLVYRDIEAKDFTLKFEMKVDGTGGSGMQYRSKSGIPWLSGINPRVLANTGPLNLNWMLTGPQADFWPSKIYSGQFYSENTPMRIMAYRGQVVEGAGLGTRRLMANIGDREELGKIVKPNDWNEYIVIARGGTFIHIINGQLMAVMVDDDPESSNNQSGNFGIEIEAVTKVFVKNVWLKKLN